MTMFSMKPKFDLAEFLAVPAPVGRGGYRGATRRTAPAQRGGAPEDAAKPAPTEATGQTGKA